MKTARDLRLLPLDAEYRKAGAVMGQTYGWERPLYFGAKHAAKLTFERPDWFKNVQCEVMADHETAAIFDASPFGKIEVKGPDACTFLQKLCMRDMDRPSGSSIYNSILNPRGTYESDLTAQRISATHYRLSVGTNAIKRDFAWLARHSNGFALRLKDSSEDYAVLALMGPDAAHIATEVGAPELNKLGYFKVGPAYIAGKHIRAVRMSYVGEAGWKITCKAENATAIYQALVAAGAQPAELYAQTSMRIEKGFCAMGHELDTDISPVNVAMAGLAKAGDFIGKDAMAEHATTRKRSLVTLVFDDINAVPIGHEPIYLNDRIIGQTSSTSFGYRINAPIALAHVNTVQADAQVMVDIAGHKTPTRMILGPADDPDGTRIHT